MPEWTVMVCPCGGLVFPATEEQGDPERDWYCPDEDEVLLRHEVQPVRVCPVSERAAAEEALGEVCALLGEWAASKATPAQLVALEPTLAVLRGRHDSG